MVRVHPVTPRREICAFPMPTLSQPSRKMAHALRAGAHRAITAWQIQQTQKLLSQKMAHAHRATARKVTTVFPTNSQRGIRARSIRANHRPCRVLVSANAGETR